MGLHSVFWGAGEMAGKLSEGRSQETECDRLHTHTHTRSLKEKANSQVTLNEPEWFHHLWKT
jgi:hypothetical protein